MDRIKYMFWLIGQASGGISYLWPISIILLALIVFTLVLVIIKHRSEFRLKVRFLPLPLIGTLIILLLGSLFEEMPTFSPTLYAGTGITLLLAGIAIYKTKGIRALSISTTIFILWFSFWCWFVSAMSITGDWM
jgi:hypothetical protein